MDKYMNSDNWWKPCPQDITLSLTYHEAVTVLAALHNWDGWVGNGSCDEAMEDMRDDVKDRLEGVLDTWERKTADAMVAWITGVQA